LLSFSIHSAKSGTLELTGFSGEKEKVAFARSFPTGKEAILMVIGRFGRGFVLNLIKKKLFPPSATFLLEGTKKHLDNSTTQASRMLILLFKFLT